MESKETMTDDEIADVLARTLDDRRQLLKIMSMNHYDMAMLEKFRKDMDFEKRQEFVYSFFPFMFRIYPYTVVTKKQKEAMKLAGVDYTYRSLYNLTFVAVRRMLRN